MGTFGPLHWPAAAAAVCPLASGARGVSLAAADEAALRRPGPFTKHGCSVGESSGTPKSHGQDGSALAVFSTRFRNAISSFSGGGSGSTADLW